MQTSLRSEVSWTVTLARCEGVNGTRENCFVGGNALFSFAINPLILVAVTNVLKEVITRTLIYLKM